MNTEAYIASGILESYVLGIATKEEVLVVEKLAQEHPEIQQEIILIQEALEAYALTHETEVPVGLKSKVMAAIAREASDNHDNEDFIKPLYPSKKPAGMSLWAIAASALLVLSLGGNWLLFGRWKNTEEQVAVLESKNLQVAQQNQVLKASYQQEVGILQSGLFQAVALKGQPIAPEAKVMVYWNKKNSEVYVASLQLPTVPIGKQYQLWAIVDGKPVNAGMIENDTLLLKMKSFPKASAFAVSLETKGGSTTEAGPKGDIFVMGAV
jgi:anti-sigma-K factor RskA